MRPTCPTGTGIPGARKIRPRAAAAADFVIEGVAVDCRYAVYRASRWRGYRRRIRLFRSVRLNGVGWLAVGLVCVVGTGVGYGVGRAADLPVGASSLAGGLFGLVVVVFVDRRRWGRLETDRSWGGEGPDAVSRIAASLRQRGVPVRLWTDRWGNRSLRYYNRDARRVRRALRDVDPGRRR
ncbi:hypothetical protein GCM10023322_34120 [Rugosimonospora acidiphila]|uniref:Uncharacterized protein n=1 Tax=Rugosimonospora acidiphila TaxID=556531 RepID=A0ABP9RUQ6_9ACTN